MAEPSCDPGGEPVGVACGPELDVLPETASFSAGGFTLAGGLEPAWLLRGAALAGPAWAAAAIASSGLGSELAVAGAGAGVAATIAAATVGSGVAAGCVLAALVSSCFRDLSDLWSFFETEAADCEAVSAGMSAADFPSGLVLPDFETSIALLVAAASVVEPEAASVMSSLPA